MHRPLAAIASMLAMLAVLAHGVGLAPHPTTVTHADSRGAGAERFHWHGFGTSHDHRECGRSELPGQPTDDGIPDHVHRCTTAFVSAAPRHMDAGSVSFVLTPALVAIVSTDDLAPRAVSIASRAHGRWCAGPPPSIRTTRLQV